MASGGGGGGSTTETSNNSSKKAPRLHVLRAGRRKDHQNLENQGAVGGVGRSPTKSRGPSDYKSGPDDKTCIVCYKEVKYFSVGCCNHSVCYECSSRMRVLMEQNECPICRQSLTHVIFTKEPRQFQELKDRLRMFIFLPQWGLYLEDEDVQRAFEKLLEHQCNFCKEVELFKDFKALKTHIQRVHDLFACDLCSEHIKLFSRERRFYNRPDLAHHKRKGDKFDKSHRGHPICQFCDRRYFDEDELYKHLRKDHYFCHFCDADGFNHYYNTFDDLRIHFRREHFLCEEEHCKDEKFTNVFRTEIDMKAHLTAVHSRLLGKHGTKQARVIDLEFSVSNDEERRSRRFNGAGFVGRGGQRGRDRDGQSQGYEQEPEEYEKVPPSFEPTNQPKVDSVTDFPLLEGAGNTTVLPLTNGTSHASSSIAQKVALTSGKNVSTSKKAVSGPGGTPRWNAKVTGSSKHDEEFPALGLSDDNSYASSAPIPQKSFTTATATTMKIHPPKPHRPPRGPPNGILSAQEEFPSLGNPSKKSSANGSAWKGSGVKMKGQMPRSLKVAPAPLERKIEVDPSGEFNFVPLSVNRARKDSLTKKYENFIDDDFLVEEKPLEDKGKKKKYKEVSQTAKAADALFNGGRPKVKSANNASGGSSSSKGASGNANGRGGMNLQDDFPSLEPVRKSLAVEEPIRNPNVAGISVSGPPPGFAKKLAAEDPFDMTFLSSSSSSSSNSNGNANKNKNYNNNSTIYEDLELLKAKAGASGKLYIQPPEFTKRNLRLLEGIKSSLSGDESSFEMFRSVSGQYKKGEINSKEYYELCQDMFGITDFRVIFPELLALLPEIDKQQELLASHRRAGGLMTGLTSCHECFQVIKAGDMSAHLQSHSAGDLFPALGSKKR